MKVINLLNKIANGEQPPKKIEVDSLYYEYDKNVDYKSKDGRYLFDNYLQINEEDMNKEIEIIEESKEIPEKIEPLQKDYMTLDDIKFTFSNSEMIIVDKINEIIDYIESKGE